MSAPKESTSEDEAPAIVFAEVLAALEDRLALPYPDRALVLDELCAEMSAAYVDLRARGLSGTDARREAVRSLALDDESLRALEEVHIPVIRRALARLPPPVRGWLEILATALPLAGLFVFLVVEVPLSVFLREGGGAIYFVLAIGVFALFIEMQRLFLWFVLRDHSMAALRRNTTTPLFLAAATVLLGFLGTALQYYGFLYRWAYHQVSAEDFPHAVREPLSCLIVGTSLATLVVLLHSALGVGLRALRIPEAKQKAD